MQETASVTAKVLSKVTVETRRHSIVKHAMDVRRAITSRNYVRFFSLFKSAPREESRNLMNLFVEKFRFDAVTVMCKAFRPTLSISHIAQVSRVFTQLGYQYLYSCSV